MSQHDSTGLKGCLNQTDNSGNTGDQSRREHKNQHSFTDSAGKRATSQTTSTETTGNEDKKTSSIQNGRNETPDKKPLSSENAEKMGKKAKSDEVQNPKPTHSASGESSSNRPSQGATMYTSDSSSDAFSSGTRPKPGIQLGPTYPFQNLKTMQNYSTEFDKKMIGHVIMIDVRIKLHSQFLYYNLTL